LKGLTDKDRVAGERRKHALNNYQVGDVSINNKSFSSHKQNSSSGSNEPPAAAKKQVARKSSGAGSSSSVEVIEALEMQRTELQETIIDMQTQINRLTADLLSYENSGHSDRSKHPKHDGGGIDGTRSFETAAEMAEKIELQRDRIEQLEHRNTNLKQVCVLWSRYLRKLLCSFLYIFLFSCAANG
jgi:FtsZ-binding cell division protein ZapB